MTQGLPSAKTEWLSGSEGKPARILRTLPTREKLADSKREVERREGKKKIMWRPCQEPGTHRSISWKLKKLAPGMS